MAVWAIGDLQGCLDPLQRLLDRIAFDPARDQLWFCGDLVNRGGESLETLRLVHSLRASSIVTLGNHDLSLLAIGERRPEEQRKVNIDLQRVLFADDRDQLLDWLRMQPLLHCDRALGWMMVHAGLAPKWTTSLAEKHAREVEQRLHGEGRRKLLRQMYGDKPAWSPRLAGSDRDRAIIKCSRACATARRAGASRSMPRARGHAGGRALSVVCGTRHAERDLKIVCGHWSALGLFIGHGVHAIDTGAVWGGKLTALQLDTDELRIVQVPGRDGSTSAVRSPAVAARQR